VAPASFSELIGQAEAVTFLERTLETGRFANGYLFHGPAGVGKGSAALAFARALLCERRGLEAQAGLFETAAEGPSDEACGRCAGCGKASRLQHPDLKFLFPVSGEEKDLDSTVQETLEAWRDDPWFVFTYEKAASIRLSLTRALLRELAFKPYEAGRRVVVVRDADRMREDQYSAMLKSLEEPGADTLWVLTTSRPTRLPATIRSRCQRVRFAALPEAQIAEFLTAKVRLAEPKARVLAALANGSLGRALELRELEPLELRNQALALFEPAARGDGPATLKAVQSFNRFGRAGRETLRRLVEFQELWLRDLLRARYGAPRAALIHRDREAEIRKSAAQISATEIRRRLMALEDALRAIEGNVTPDLALFSGLMRAGDPGFETTSWPAHAGGRWDY